MSLFNRLEKIRARADQEEESVFGVTDLGPRASKAPASPPTAAVDEALKRRSPLEILQEQEARERALKQATQAPKTAPDAGLGSRLKARIEAATTRETEAASPTFAEAAPIVDERAIDAPDEAAPAEIVDVPWPMTPFKPTLLLEEAQKKASEAFKNGPEDDEKSAVFAEAPLETPPALAPDENAPAPTLPAPALNPRATAFDRLMAARSNAEREPRSVPLMPAGPVTTSLADRLAAINAAPTPPPDAPANASDTSEIAAAPPEIEAQAPLETPALAQTSPEIEAPPAAESEVAVESQNAPLDEISESAGETQTVASAPEIESAPTIAPPAETVAASEISSEMPVLTPEMAQTSSEMAETSLAMAETSSEMAETSSEVVETSPEVVETSSEMAETSPEVVETSPEVAETSSEMSAPIPVAETPPVEAPVLSLRERLMMQQTRAEAPAPPTPEVRAETAEPPVARTVNPSAPKAPTAPLSMSDRFAARGNIDRLPTQEALEIAANAATPNPQALGRTGVALALTQDGPASEREAANRSLYSHKHLIFDAVLGALDPRSLSSATKDSLRPVLERAIDSAARGAGLDLSQPEKNWMLEEFTREALDLGPLVSLLEDASVNKILVAGASEVAVEKLGRIERTGISFRDDDHLLAIVRRIAEMTGGRLDAKVPLLDRPLPDGARIRAKIPPLAPQPTLTIEKSTGNPFVALKRQQADRSKGEALPYSQLRDRIQQHLLREFETQTGAVTNTEKLRAQVEEMITQVIAEERVVVTRAEKAALVMDLLNEIVGLGPLEPLLNDPEIDEIMVNGPYQIYVERKGKLEVSGQRFRDNGHVMQVIDRIIAPLGRRVDEKSPMVDGRLRDGSRFNAIIPPLALSGPTITIRKFARDPLTMTDLINFGSLSREAAHFLQCAVEGRLNVVVSGGTGSGKTTTLNVLSSFIPSSERIVTIEDAAELQLRQEHVIRLETRPPNIEGVGEIAIRDLVRNALRMRPDRIVIGECRGGEALDMLQAMNTGHDGSLTTGHSNGPRDTLKRLETMVMMAGFDLPIKAIREQIAMAVQLIVHQERMRDGKRRVVAITEIVGMEGDVITMQDLYRFEQERIDDDGRIIGSLVSTGLRPKNYDTIVDNGVELPMELFQIRSQAESGVRGRLNEHRVGAR